MHGWTVPVFFIFFVNVSITLVCSRVIVQLCVSEDDLEVCLHPVLNTLLFMNQFFALEAYS